MTRQALLQDLEAQGVQASLLKEVVKDFPEDPSLKRPAFTYLGAKVWQAAITALLSGDHLLLVGSKATGKNVLAEDLAYLFSRPYRTVSFHVNSDASTLLGTDSFKNNEVVFRPGPIYDAAQKGAFAILDEINMARNDAIAVLHAALDYRRMIDLPGYSVLALDRRTRFLATMNDGYLGTRELNEALLSRFLVLQVPAIDRQGLVLLLGRRFPDLTEEGRGRLADLFQALHKKNEQAEISSKAVDLRGLLAAIGLMRKGLSPLQSLHMGLTYKSRDPYEQEIVADLLKLYLSEKEEAKAFFTKKGQA